MEEGLSDTGAAKALTTTRDTDISARTELGPADRGRPDGVAHQARGGVHDIINEVNRMPSYTRCPIRPPWSAVTGLAALMLLALASSACQKDKEAEKQAGPAPPPPTVVVAEVVQKTVPIYSEFVARTDAKDTVEIRARVQAFLEAQHFTEGTVVKKDQVLFTLDKREYEAQLQQARAQLAKAQADLAFAKDNATVETAKANLDVALARLGKADTDERRLKPLAEQRRSRSRTTTMPSPTRRPPEPTSSRAGRASTRRRSTRRAASSRPRPRSRPPRPPSPRRS